MINNNFLPCLTKYLKVVSSRCSLCKKTKTTRNLPKKKQNEVKGKGGGKQHNETAGGKNFFDLIAKLLARILIKASFPPKTHTHTHTMGRVREP